MILEPLPRGPTAVPALVAFAYLYACPSHSRPARLLPFALVAALPTLCTMHIQAVVIERPAPPSDGLHRA